jgi:hypothetical protein
LIITANSAAPFFSPPLPDTLALSPCHSTTYALPPILDPDSDPISPPVLSSAPPFITLTGTTLTIDAPSTLFPSTATYQVTLNLTDRNKYPLSRTYTLGITFNNQSLCTAKHIPSTPLTPSIIETVKEAEGLVKLRIESVTSDCMVTLRLS